MGNAEGSAPVERQISQTNALDIVLKYAAASAALVYGVGFLEEIEYASRLGVGSVDFPLANPRYFAVGTLMLLVCLWSVAGVLPVGTIIERAGSGGETLRRLMKYVEKLNYAIARILVFVLAFVGSHWVYFLPTAPALALAVVALVINGIVLSIVRSPDRYLLSPIQHQIGLMLTLATFLTLFCIQCGHAHWCKQSQTAEASTRERRNRADK
jgi:predicted membrane protein